MKSSRKKGLARELAKFQPKAEMPSWMFNAIVNEDCMLGMTRIPDKSVELVIADIPFNECNSFEPGFREINKGKADEATFELEPFLSELDRIVAGSVYIFCGFEQVSEIRRQLKGRGFSTRVCVWKKTNPSPMNGKFIWLSNVELCVFGKKPKATFNAHCKGVVWEFPVGRSKRHPTEKSLKLIEYLVSVSSNPGDLVLDPCMGSGTTAEAAMKQGRNFVGFEIDAGFCNVARARVGQIPVADCANDSNYLG
jgi:site-specific DNA-methyltransferase (adenine-specific)